MTKKEKRLLEEAKAAKAAAEEEAVEEEAVEEEAVEAPKTTKTIPLHVLNEAHRKAYFKRKAIADKKK